MSLHAPEFTPLQIPTANFEAEGVCLGPKQLKELKGLTEVLDKQKKRKVADEDWCNLLDHV